MPHSGIRSGLLAAFVLVSAVACSGGGVSIDHAKVVAVFGKDHVAAAPAAAPELIALGKALYHDQRLSTKGNISCASCHDLARFGTDGQATSPGTDGVRGDRNSPPSVNAFRQFAQFWDGRAKDVEEQAQGPVLNPIEHGFATAADFEAKLASLPGMTERFGKLFPGEKPVSLANFGKAVGAFERTLITKSRFDEYLDGRQDALTDAEKQGLSTFMSSGCTACHNGRTLGGGMYQKLGLVKPYPTEDPGRAKVTGNPAEQQFFKVPMLLNVAETGPWFHDGKVATLEEAVRLMGSHQLGKDLTKAEIDSIVGFLRALSGKLAN